MTINRGAERGSKQADLGLLDVEEEEQEQEEDGGPMERLPWLVATEPVLVLVTY